MKNRIDKRIPIINKIISDLANDIYSNKHLRLTFEAGKVYKRIKALEDQLYKSILPF